MDMADALDGDLLERFVKGDQEAFEALFRRFEFEAYRWILRIIRNPGADEDRLKRLLRSPFPPGDASEPARDLWPLIKNRSHATTSLFACLHGRDRRCRVSL